jgi:hypothetical protein
MFYVPTGTPHAFEVTSDEATFLVVTYKLGFENWFVELGEPVSEYAFRRGASRARRRSPRCET